MPFVAVLQQGSIVAARHPLQQHVDIRLQPDRNAHPPHVIAGFRIDESAAASGDDTRFSFQQSRNNTTFAVAKSLFAIPGEYFLDRTIGRRFDFVIGIDEIHAEFPRQPGADTGLTGAHQPDQNDGFIARDYLRGVFC